MVFTLPLNVIANWPKPNYDNPVTRSHFELWFLPGIFLFAATTCVFARLWVRVYVRRWFGVDDLCILIAFLCTVGVSALVGIGNSREGWDRHIWDVKFTLFSPSLRILYWTRIFWGQAASFTRFSVICLYYRLIKACEAPRHFFWIMHVATFLNVAIWLNFLFTGIFPCYPINAYWTWPANTKAYCINDGTSMQAAGVLNTFAEFILAILPVFAVFRLRVQKKQRWAIIALLSMGYIVVIAGCCRTYFIWRVLESNDLTWYSGPQWICSEIENDLALIVACAVPLKPAFGRTLRHFNITKVVDIESKESGSDTLTSYTNHKADAREILDWEASMRIVDLEGIADDGLGYTVTITGPLTPRPGEKPLSWFQRSLLSKAFSRRESTQSATSSEPTPVISIPQKTELAIRESWRGSHDRTDRWGSITSNTSGSIMDLNTSLDQFQFSSERPESKATVPADTVGFNGTLHNEDLKGPALALSRSSHSSVPEKATEILGMNSIPEDQPTEDVYEMSPVPSRARFTLVNKLLGRSSQ
ncbi:hypothetical protein BT63DRAFT_456279 [Microthyrium microscopicum]|uniref:Rhodopsin domain-containing protein n=1 Tax=Microthyrium microscopicum TaxID=703497 RepID=A0A6A6UB14_9PEZI|nr:hypothetical protein BT63DRAFT_456279 [Microthyrium microscopicum]